MFFPQEHQTPLHVSSRLGSIEAVQLLLQNNATRDATTKELYTPLHIAVKEGHEEVIQLLLDSGAKQKVKTKVYYMCQRKILSRPHILLIQEDLLTLQSMSSFLN